MLEILSSSKNSLAYVTKVTKITKYIFQRSKICSTIDLIINFIILKYNIGPNLRIDTITMANIYTSTNNGSNWTTIGKKKTIINRNNARCDTTTLFRNKRLMLDEMTRQNASKFAMFYVIPKPKVAFSIFHQA